MVVGHCREQMVRHMRVSDVMEYVIEESIIPTRRDNK